MKYLFILAFLLLSQTADCQTYRVAYRFTKRSPDTIAVSARFLNLTKDISSLLLPSEWAGQKDLYNCINNLKVIDGSVQLEPTARPDSFLVTHANGKEFTITYDLHQDITGPLKYPYYFRPVIQDSIFFITGYSGLVYPGLKEGARMQCTVDYAGFAAEATTGNSYFFNSKHDEFTTTLAELRNAFYFAGHTRFKEFTRPGSKVIIAVSGQYAFTDEQLFSSISQLIYEERKFWKDTTDPYFMVTLIPVESNTSGGTAYHNSFSIFYNPGFKLNQGLQYLIAHEYFHTWIGQKMKQKEPEESGKWFVEGFTDYYAYKMLRKTGILSEDEYIAKLNDIIKQYYHSSRFTYENKNILGHYFEDPTVKQLAYNRGLILAMLLNGKIEIAGKGTLDDLMRDYFNRLPYPKVYNEEAFFDLLKNYVTPDVIRMVADINEGKNGSLPGNLSMKGYDVGQKELMKFVLGFDLNESKKANTITGVIAGSAAETAGLRNGQKMDGAISIWNGDPDKPAKITIIENGEKRTIQYTPAEKTGIIAPILIIKKNQ